jgi:hypothetical protein
MKEQPIYDNESEALDPAVKNLNERNDIAIYGSGGGCVHFEKAGHIADSYWLINGYYDDVDMDLAKIKLDTYCIFGFHTDDSEDNVYFFAEYSTGVNLIAHNSRSMFDLLKQNQKHLLANEEVMEEA